MADIHKGWSRGSIGYRDAQLDSSDFTAAMTLFVAGVPAMVIGSELALQGVGLGQMILAVPFGVLLGGLVLGLVGRQAAASGVPSAYLSRAAFGSIGSVFFSLARLLLTIGWAALSLRIAAGWVEASLATWDLSFNNWGIVVVIAVLALAAFLPGPVWALAELLRRRVFLIAIVVLLVATWRVLLGSDPVSSAPATGGFLETVDAVFGLGILWAIVGGDFGGYGRREEETATGLGYGFVVSGLVFVMAGAALTQRLGGPPTDLLLFGAGTAGAVLALIWVPLMEVDGVGGLNVSSTWSVETLVPGIPPRILYVLVTAASVAGSVLVDADVLRSAADVALSLVAPGLGVLLIDAYVMRGGAHSADELVRWRGEYGWLNPFGLLSWVVGAAVTLWLRPKTGVVRDWLPSWPGDGPGGLPGLLIGSAVASLVYFVIGRMIFSASGRVYRLRS
ncbi:MAG TPA: cytosine permease [Acidimicrobiia bacterium]|nr:cytosine permease [Acidimicrobiia bacterium]